MDAGARRFGEDAPDLGEGAGDRGRGRRRADLLREQEANRQGEGLVLGEDQRRELEAGAQLVAAVAAALGLDRDAQILERLDVLADGANVHLQPLGEGRAGHPPVGLEQLEDGQDAGRWAIDHALASRRDSLVIRSDCTMFEA